MRLGYYSAVTHSDWLFGKALDTLEEIGAANDTLVVVTGDHGWQLGEHAEWGKHTNFELAVQVPLLVRAPWAAHTSAGKHTSSLVELVDLYRSIVSLAGLPASAVPVDVDGSDFSSLLKDPEKNLKELAFSQYPRCPHKDHPQWFLNNCENVAADQLGIMGYSVRSHDWRYTEWFKWDGSLCRPDFTASYGVELYSHEGEVGHPIDFDAYENENVATDPANEAIIKLHRATLLKNFNIQSRQTQGCPPSPLPTPAKKPGPGRTERSYYDATREEWVY